MSQPTAVDSLISHGLAFAKDTFNPTALSTILRQPSSGSVTALSDAPRLVFLLPLLASTAQLQLSLGEYLALRPFVQDFRRSEIPDRALQSWWTGYWLSGLGNIVVTGMGAIGTGLWAASRCAQHGPGASGAKWAYRAGAVFALGHYAFGQSVSKIIRLLVYGPPKDTRRLSNAWLKLHALRTLTTDVPAFLCFLFAACA